MECNLRQNSHEAWGYFACMRLHTKRMGTLHARGVLLKHGCFACMRGPFMGHTCTCSTTIKVIPDTWLGGGLNINCTCAIIVTSRTSVLRQIVF